MPQSPCNDPTEVADVKAIRAHFPALARRHRDLPVAYFDGPGGTQVPRQVAEAVAEHLLAHNSNLHWAYPTSQEAELALAHARAALADYVNGHPDEIVFGPNMTTLTFHIGRGLGQAWGPEDEIVVTELDHHANVDPWRWLGRERGVRVRTVRMDPATSALDPSDLEQAIGPRTRLVAIGAASNLLGTITDVAAIADMAHQHGALVFVDAVHYAAHLVPDVQAFGCDLLACSAYKFYGPHVGVLWGRRKLLDTLDAPKLVPAPNTPPEKLETGTQNHEGIVGAAAAVDFLASLTPSGDNRRTRLLQVSHALHARGQDLVERLWEGLHARPGVHVMGPAPDSARTSTVSFAVDGQPSRRVAEALADRAVFVSNGDFYATSAVSRLGYAEHGLVRAGCAAYTTAEEIDRLLDGVRSLAGS